MEKLKKLIHRYYEVLSYLFFGVLATALNIVLYTVFQLAFGYEAANSWGNVLDNILCILFAYWTNRTWVFVSKTHGKEALAEFAKFVTCRLGTLAVDVAIMYVGGNLLAGWGSGLVVAVLGGLLQAETCRNLWGLGVKVLSNVVVVVLNYVFSKLLIFTKK